jgi:hypothetical protein
MPPVDPAVVELLAIVLLVIVSRPRLRIAPAPPELVLWATVLLEMVIVPRFDKPPPV